ncbi:hypothetical protein RRG08_046172 [Elysia crispata]|uniref:Uncharacterized protein n=1 Tax=Elysia crispata TaxID=231223 RepID=A0AAE0XN93_9GAST|nr:hypothetical protein RRG08_046172 [Elysia crispata]
MDKSIGEASGCGNLAGYDWDGGKMGKLELAGAVNPTRQAIAMAFLLVLGELFHLARFSGANLNMTDLGWGSFPWSMELHEILFAYQKNSVLVYKVYSNLLVLNTGEGKINLQTCTCMIIAEDGRTFDMSRNIALQSSSSCLRG